MSFMEVLTGMLGVENATISDLQEALASKQTTVVDLVRAYAARINAYDGAGPCLNAVRSRSRALWAAF